MKPQSLNNFGRPADAMVCYQEASGCIRISRFNHRWACGDVWASSAGDSALQEAIALGSPVSQRALSRRILRKTWPFEEGDRLGPALELVPMARRLTHRNLDYLMRSDTKEAAATRGNI